MTRSIVTIMLVCISAINLFGKTREAECQWDAESQWYQSVNKYDTCKIDVLYFISTEVLSAKDSNGDVSWQSLLTDQDRKAMTGEMSWFEKKMFYSDFNVIAPYYHQYTFDAIWQLTPKQFDKVYKKVVKEACEAFDYYMEHINNGRPFILAGFSQGAALTVDILRHMTDEQYSHMIACYTLGYRLSKKDLKHRHIKAATGETDYGVVISFNSVLNTDAIWPHIAKDAATCINPVNWRTDETPAKFSYKETNNEVHVDTHSNVLIVKTDNPDFFHSYYDNAPFFLNAGVSKDNLHHWDLQFYRTEIHDNALKRAASIK